MKCWRSSRSRILRRHGRSFFAKLSYFVHADKCIYTCSPGAILGAYENTASLAERLKVFAAVQLGEWFIINAAHCALEIKAVCLCCAINLKQPWLGSDECAWMWGTLVCVFSLHTLRVSHRLTVSPLSSPISNGKISHFCLEQTFTFTMDFKMTQSWCLDCDKCLRSAQHGKIYNRKAQCGCSYGHSVYCINEAC